MYIYAGCAFNLQNALFLLRFGVVNLFRLRAAFEAFDDRERKVLQREASQLLALFAVATAAMLLRIVMLVCKSVALHVSGSEDTDTRSSSNDDDDDDDDDDNDNDGGGDDDDADEYIGKLQLYSLPWSILDDLIPRALPLFIILFLTAQRPDNPEDPAGYDDNNNNNVASSSFQGIGGSLQSPLLEAVEAGEAGLSPSLLSAGAASDVSDESPSIQRQRREGSMHATMGTLLNFINMNKPAFRNLGVIEWRHLRVASTDDAAA